MNEDVFIFFEELQANNNREWFLDNKSRYDTIKEEFTEFTGEIIEELSLLDPSIGHPDPKKCLYRIYRDLRFSPDKRPYKTQIAFFLSSNGIKRSGEAGYYLQIGQEEYGLHGNCSLGGGIFMPDKEKLASIRQEIFYNTDQFLSIINEKKYKKYFGSTFFTTKFMSRAPKGYPNDWEHVELLKYNDYCTMHEVPKEVVLGDGFKDYVMKVFSATVPLNKFILQSTQ